MPLRYRLELQPESLQEMELALGQPSRLAEIAMPLRHRLVATQHPRTQELRLRLVDEWRNPREDDPKAPIIIEEDGRGVQPTHLYVIWDDWADLTLQERSEIIMDAYEEVRGRDASLSVSVAMGVTGREAKRMGIAYG
jgi:hypothetical protein